MHTLSPSDPHTHDFERPHDEPGEDGQCVGGSYVLIERIGGGATGTVWRAIEQSTGDEVAVKLLREDLMSQPKAVTRFVQEHAILLMLRHPNIVRVRDLLSVGTTLGLVMDLQRGGSLRDSLDEGGPLPPAEAARLLAQVAAALTEAHKAGVVHRDLKPDNVLIEAGRSGQRVRLTDFGIARALDAPGITTPDSLVGTPNYMAPEVICGGRATPAVDVYALGVMLYELVTGRQPYDGGPPLAILRRHVDSTPPPVDGMPEVVWRVVRACMDRRPRRRPTAQELVTTMRSLARLTEGLPALPVPAQEPRHDAVPHVPAQRAHSERSDIAWWSRRPWSNATFLVAILVATLVAVGLPGIRILDSSGREKADVGTPRAKSPAPAPGAAVAAGPAPATPGPSAAPSSSASPRTPTASLKLTAPGVGVEAGLYGPWECMESYGMDLGHPVLAKPCHSIEVSGSGHVRMLGRMQALPGVQVDMTLKLVDADTGEVVGAPHGCYGMMFTDFAPEQSCGPFQLVPPSGHEYVVVQEWRYTGRSLLPAGAVRGMLFRR